MHEQEYETNDIVQTFSKEKFVLYEIYSNISKQHLGKIYLTDQQYEVLTKAFQHRGTLHQDLALLKKGE